jgi:hypothetical protein
MSCTIATILYCTYLKAGLAYELERGAAKEPTYATVNDEVYRFNGYHEYDPNKYANPLGTVEMGTEWTISARFEVDVYYRHQSFLGTTKDMGQDMFGVAMKGYLFKKR